MSRRIVVILAIMTILATTPSARATPFAYRPDGSIVDTATDTVVGGVSGMNGQGGVAMNPAGTRVYLLHFGGSSGMKVIDTGTNTVIATVSAVSPFGHVAVHPSGGRVYATSTNNTSVLVIDAATNAVVNTIVVGNLPQGLTVLPDGSRVYVVTREPSAGSPSSVAVIDTASDYAVTTINNAGVEPRGIAITNGGGDDAQETVFVTQFLSLPVAGKLDGADDAKAGHVTVISAATNTVVADVVVNPIANTGFRAQSLGSWSGGFLYPANASLSIYWGVLTYNDPCAVANWNIHAVTGVGVTGTFGQPFNSSSSSCGPPPFSATTFIDLQNCLLVSNPNLFQGYGSLSAADVVWSLDL